MKEINLYQSKLINNSFNLVELIKDFELKLINQNLPTNTISKYVGEARSFITFKMNNSDHEVNENDIINYLSKNPNLSPSTWNNKLTYLRQFFKFLQSQKIFPDITTGIRGKRVKREFKKDSLPPEVITEIYHYFESRVELAFESNDKRIKPLAALRNLAFISIIISMGSRAGKTTLIKIKDIRDQITKYGNFPSIGIPDKAYEEITFRPIPDFVFKNIEKYLAHLDSYNQNDFLFRSTKPGADPGKAISYDQMLKVITRALKNLGIKNASHKNRISPHSFRHTLGELIVEKHGAEYLQRFFGHKSLTTSQMYYGRNAEQKLFQNPPDIKEFFHI